MTTSFATFGNELYTGKRSYNFVNSKKIWFIIAAVAVALSILIPVAKGGFNLGIEFRGGSEFTVSNVKHHGRRPRRKGRPGRRGGQHPARGQRRRHHHADPDGQAHRRRDQLTIKEGLTSAYGVTENEVTSTFVGPTWGADVTKQALHRPGDLRGLRGRPDGAVLPDLENVVVGPCRACS